MTNPALLQASSHCSGKSKGNANTIIRVTFSVSRSQAGECLSEVMRGSVIRGPRTRFQSRTGIINQKQLSKESGSVITSNRFLTNFHHIISLGPESSNGQATGFNHLRQGYFSSTKTDHHPRQPVGSAQAVRMMGHEFGCLNHILGSCT